MIRRGGKRLNRVLWRLLVYNQMNSASSQASPSLQQMAEIERQLRVKLARARRMALDPSDDSTNLNPQGIMLQLEQLEPPQFDPRTDYNEQYWKVYLDNEIYCAQIRQSAELKGRLSELISQIEGLQSEHHRLNRIKNRKKNRRLATEIDKSFMCPYHKCRKVYGSDVSLNMHIKLKHNGGNKTDRQKLAQRICSAEENGEPCPEMTLNLPPGYMTQYRKLYFQKEAEEGQGAPSVSSPGVADSFSHSLSC